MTSVFKPAFLAVICLAACANKAPEDPEGGQTSLGSAIKQLALQQAAKWQGSGKAAAPVDANAIAADALRANANPLILVGIESQGTTQALALVQQNGAMRTYMTSGSQAVILQDGMLIGTKGLGNDLSAADIGPSAALIRAGRSGQAKRVMYYLTGEGVERPLPLTCDIAPGPKAGVMTETCQGAGASFQNHYLIQQGRITVSQQWIGPALGPMTIQTLRP